MFMFCFKRSFVLVLLLTLSTTSLFATRGEREDENPRPLKRPRLMPKEPRYSIEALPDELHLIIFSSLNQKDIPSVTRTSKRWQRLMDDNQLWKGYAKRAFLIYKEDPSQDRDYKALVREHSIPSFTDLGILNGGSGLWASAISFDGSVIVGEAYDGAAQDERRAFIWTADKGMESLGTLNGGRWSSAKGISFDGLVVVGLASDGAEQNQARAFIWTAEKGIISLGTLNGGSMSSAYGISSDGSVIVGQSKDGNEQDQERAFRWTAEGGIESVEKMLTYKGLLPAQWKLTKVSAITPSGTVLTGEGTYNNGSTRAWRAVIPRKHLF